MRRISMAHTVEPFLDGSKTVTRRLGWLRLKAGDHLLAVRKARGVRNEDLEVLGEIEVLSVARQRLDECSDEEAVKEGFPQLTGRRVRHLVRSGDGLHDRHRGDPDRVQALRHGGAMSDQLLEDMEHEALRQMDRDLGGTGDGSKAADVVGFRGGSIPGLADFLRAHDAMLDRLQREVNWARQATTRAQIATAQMAGLACILGGVVVGYLAGAWFGGLLLLPAAWLGWWRPGQLHRRLVLLELNGSKGAS